MTVLSDAWQFPATVKSLFMAGTVAIAAIASAACDVAQVHVMTRNVYDGIDYQGRFSPGTQDLAKALRDTLADITATDPVARAALHASQIAREHPDLLAIQEAVQLDGNPPVDMLSALVMELAKLGKPYKIIVKMKGLDTGSGAKLLDTGTGNPILDTGSGSPIRISIWDAILVRSDLPPHDRVVNDIKQGLYTLSVNPVTIQGIARGSDPNNVTQEFAYMNLRRNWMFVDMQLHGHAFRFVTTHLDIDMAPTPQRQSGELLEAVGNTRLPVIVAGDFNDEYKNYSKLAAADYRDAWIEGGGATCCQDDDGATWGQYPKTSPWTRTKKIDLILLRGGVSATSARLVGAMAPPCSPQGCTLLASDHAGVVAGLVFTSTINFHPVWLLIAIGGMLLFAGLLLGVPTN